LNLENPYFSSICDPNKKLISPKKYIRWRGIFEIHSFRVYFESSNFKSS
jgi:hypothetical protein